MRKQYKYIFKYLFCCIETSILSYHFHCCIVIRKRGLRETSKKAHLNLPLGLFPGETYSNMIQTRILYHRKTATHCSVEMVGRVRVRDRKHRRHPPWQRD